MIQYDILVDGKSQQFVWALQALQGLSGAAGFVNEDLKASKALKFLHARRGWFQPEALITCVKSIDNTQWEISCWGKAVRTDLLEFLRKMEATRIEIRYELR